MINEVLTAISQRRTHRAYKPDPLGDEQLQFILDAAISSPSSVNGQPWHFSVVHNQDLLDKISKAAADNALKRPKDKRSPRFDDPAFQVFYHAPTVIFISTQKGGRFTQVDCGIAVNNIALAAHSLGIGSVILGLPVEAFESELGPQLEKELQFPEGNHFVIAISLGVATDSKAAPERHPDKISTIS